MKSYTQLEHDFYLNKTNSTAGTPLNDMKRAFLEASTGITGVSMADKLQGYLKTIIYAHSQTPNSKYTSDLLKQAVVVLGLPVSNNQTANWRILYENI